MFNNWVQNPHGYSIPAGLRDTVYKWGVNQFSPTEWEKVLHIYEKESDPQEKVRLLRALAFTKEPETLRR